MVQGRTAVILSVASLCREPHRLLWHHCTPEASSCCCVCDHSYPQIAVHLEFTEAITSKKEVRGCERCTKRKAVPLEAVGARHSSNSSQGQPRASNRLVPCACWAWLVATYYCERTRTTGTRSAISSYTSRQIAWKAVCEV